MNDTASATTTSPATDRLRRVRSFVRREGRLTTAQAQALETLWPHYGVELADAAKVAERFARVAPLVVDIGFGNGDAVLWRAQHDPDRNYLGIEVHRPGVGGLMHRAHAGGLDNLRVACEDAVAFVTDMPASSIDTCVIEFPDPWPKKRHHKRRLIQPDFVAMLVARLRIGGHLMLATDWADYAEHMLDVLNDAPGLANAASDGGFAARWALRPQTRFELRGLKRGHRVFDLGFVRV